ncbi:phage baseplate assembly protein W [Aquimarina sp. EL_43]|uniref:GPW/gp25 family protein n=1 Tax=Aquimarina TaxID=290174 RepID=UPI0004717A5C|nr:MULTISPECIES: GPW/gp25 family protein [Aquimarina]MBG6132807.1 phage baseplate assembly protein W [Aquimarina sp. EL_35]MBG6153116.1 phage baseplate assembly protein W [Aquimarina sp. EL_32]MBG6171272.1 phage baseplate assembly protein W [Aquimarina sp. EL_43]
MNKAKDFIGVGWSFPPTFNREKGQLETTELFDDIQKSLEILLTTRPGERVMQPKYGCHMETLLFESLDTGTKTMIKERIRIAILYFEPRIEAKKITLDDSRQNEGVLLISIEYIVSSTNSRFNFVFPFYSEEATEMNILTTNHPLAV